MRNLRLSFSDAIAFTLEQEAQMEGIEVPEIIRRGTATYIIAKMAQRDVIANFPVGEVLSFSLIIEAVSTSGIIKQFELHPDLSNPGGTQIKIIED